ncbi:uncharacterized protein LOC135224838 [Macrobrachium nipponense]|uniref:uncharacterized protein LOC135224838 n=1 Tax=Macrobrachium nipponense TaxID=159736 RepID=UPI0030C83C00
MENLLKKKKAARGWVSRLGKELISLLGRPVLSAVELKAVIDNFDIRLSKLDEVQSEIEVELESDLLDDDLDKAFEFRTSLIPRIKAAEKLLELDKKGDDVSSTTNGSSGAQVKLPKLELPKFKGEVTEWQSFWDQFSCHVDNSDIPVISKFSYLASLLEGEAKSFISGLSHTSVNYIRLHVIYLRRDLEGQRG